MIESTTTFPELHGIGPPQLTHTRTSAVTTAWGVDWDEDYIARDLMQNFFDANRDRLAEVEVAIDGKDVRISAPAAFNLERLFYLGSEKGEDDIGHYGEGFKVAATCLLRNHAVTILVASGHAVLHLRIADESVHETDLFPVEYDFYESEAATVGTVLLLGNCAPKVTKAMAQGLSHFLHDGNPLLGASLWESVNKDFSIYESTDGKGHVFYRKLKRGEIADIPLVLVINRTYDSIEKKISKDRDRNAFGDKIMRMFFNHFARFGVKQNVRAAEMIVARASQCWSNGHTLLSELAAAVMYPDWSSATGRRIFGAGYFARSTSNLPAEKLAFETLEKQWRDQEKVCLPQYFSSFGLLNAKRFTEDLRAKELKEAKRGNRMAPTRGEA